MNALQPFWLILMMRKARQGLDQQPVGLIRVTTSASYANHVLIPLLADFFVLYPEIQIDLAQTDLVIDLLAERTDVAIRTGPLKSSRLVARKLGQTELVIVASPNTLSGLEPRNVTRIWVLIFASASAMHAAWADGHCFPRGGKPSSPLENKFRQAMAKRCETWP